jgi:prophage regulatory protein
MAGYRPERVLRLKQVLERVGLGRSRIFELVKEGGFPRQIRLSLRAVGWLESDVEKWISDRVASRSQKA